MGSGKHNNQDFDLWTVLQGRGQMKTPKKEYHLLPGDCFLLDLKQEQYIGTHDPDNPLIVIYVHFDFIDNDSNINRIAELLGYSDLAHFSKQFNTRVGMPPSTYRKADQL